MVIKHNLKYFFYCTLISLLFVLFLNFIFVTYTAYINNAINEFSINTLIKFYKENVFMLEYKGNTESNLNFSQEKYYTCGPAALKYLLHYYGIKVSEEKLVELMNTTKDGSSLYNMKKVLDKYRLSGEGLHVNYAKLKEIKMPAIVFVKNNHFIVIREVTDSHVYLFDPDPKYGYLKLPKATFLKVWNGVILKAYTKEI